MTLSMWLESLPIPSLSRLRPTPVPKPDAPTPLASELRPIDAYSCVMRIHASVLAGALKGWARNVLVDGQYSAKGGIIPALARIVWHAETAYPGLPGFYSAINS